ncbi:MAG: SH3 domain-containing protein [Acidobacteria bacterium]|nr:SH3 domain-containing protein [Acidobacteriaceae bacterium]MBV9608751.1 SH3 domain-containing protein [Acidobacteriota bacterium]
MALLALLIGCGVKSEKPKQYEYVSAPQVMLRDNVAAVYNKVGIVKNGERVEVLEKSRRFVHVHTERNETGWMEQRYLVSQEVYDGFQKLAADTAHDVVQAHATARFDVNLHVTPDRESEHFYQLKEGDKVELLARATAPKPGAVATAKPVSEKKNAAPPAPALEDWWVVRDTHGHAGWLLSRMVDLDVPIDIAQYAEGQRIVAYFVLNQVPDEGKQVPQYLVALTEPRDGLPFDYNQIRVFTWNLRRHRYETAYRDRRLSGVFPISIGKQNFEKEGVLPTFTLKLKDESGQVTSSTYKLNGPIVKRVVAEGEQPKAPHVAPEKRQARRARLRKK